MHIYKLEYHEKVYFCNSIQKYVYKEIFQAFTSVTFTDYELELMKNQFLSK